MDGIRKSEIDHGERKVFSLNAQKKIAQFKRQLKLRWLGTVNYSIIATNGFKSFDRGSNFWLADVARIKFLLAHVKKVALTTLPILPDTYYPLKVAEETFDSPLFSSRIKTSI